MIEIFYIFTVSISFTMNKLLTLFAFCLFPFAFLNAQIIYTDVNPDSIYTADERYYLDMDNDGTDDYIIEQVDSVVFGNPLEGVQLRSVGTINEAVYENGSLTFLKGLAANTLIDINQTWTVPTPSLPAGGVIMVGSTPTSAGDWSDALEHYAGVYFTTGANSYYGWVRFTVTADGMGFTIMDYAYHTTAEQPILAGAIVDGLTENENSGFEITKTGNLVTIQNTISNKNTVEVYDVSGKLIETFAMNENYLTIDLTKYESGIYLVRCWGEMGERVEKINK